MQFPQGFLIAERDVRCLDVWPLGKVRKTAMMAYLQLERGGEIRIRYPVVIYPDRLGIKYDAQMPHEWARERLKQTEGALVQTLMAERDRLKSNLLGMVEAVRTDDLLPIFEKTAARYLDLQRILVQEEISDALQAELQEH